MDINLISIIYTPEGYKDRVKMLMSLGNTVDTHIIISAKYIKSFGRTVVVFPKKNMNALEFWIWAYRKIKKIERENDKIKWVVHEYLSGVTNFLLFLDVTSRVKRVTSLYSVELDFLKKKGWGVDKYSNESISFNQKMFWIKKSIPTVLMNYITWIGSNVILGNSEDVINDFKWLFKKKTTYVIKTFIDTNVFKSNDFNSQLNVIPELIFASRINPPKGIGLMFKALADLKNEGYKFNFKIIGSPWEIERKWYNNMINKFAVNTFANVVPHVSQAELINHLKSSDIFIFPSFYEGSPRIIKEAMSCGLVCISSDLSGVRMIDKYGESILYFKKGNLIEMKEKIIWSLNNFKSKEFNKRRSKLDELMSSFNEENVMFGLLSIYEKTLNQ